MDNIPETTLEAEDTGFDMNRILELFKSFLAILLPLIGLDFLSKYLDNI